MERFRVPREVLANRPDEAILIVRAGAIANAIVSIGSMLAGSMARGVGRERDLLQALLLMLSYLKEAADLIDNKLARELVAEGVAAGYSSLRPIPELQAVFSRGKDSLYRRLAHDIRNKKGFHIDEEVTSHFHEWLKHVQKPYFSPDVTLWRKDSGMPIDWAFTASAQIQSLFGPKIDKDSILVLKDAPGIVFLVEAMACGMLARAGLDPRAAFRPTVRRQIRIDYDLHGRRPAVSEVVIMTVDADGDPTGTVSDLRDRVTEMLGGRRVGAVIPGSAIDPHTDAHVAFHNANGTARAWFGPVVRDEPPVNAGRFAAVQIRDMAEWGRDVTTRALAFAQSVEQGKATPQEVQKFIAALQRDLAYWARQKDYAESFDDASFGGSPR